MNPPAWRCPVAADGVPIAWAMYWAEVGSPTCPRCAGVGLRVVDKVAEACACALAGELARVRKAATDGR